MKVESASHKALVSMTFCTGHHSGMRDVSLVSLAH